MSCTAAVHMHGPLIAAAPPVRAILCSAPPLPQSLPWSTRERAVGEMHVRGTKARMDTVVFPSTAANRFTATGLLSVLHSHPAAPTTFVASEHWLEATRKRQGRHPQAAQQRLHSNQLPLL